RSPLFGGAGRYGASGVVLGRARILTWHSATLRSAPSLRPSQPPRLAPSRESLPGRGPPCEAARGDTGRLEVVSKSRRQALRSCAVGLFLVSKPHATRSGKAGTPFFRPLLALSSVGRESSRGIQPRCGPRPPCVLANHPVSPLPESRSPAGARRAKRRGAIRGVWKWSQKAAGRHSGPAPWGFSWCPSPMRHGRERPVPHFLDHFWRCPRSGANPHVAFSHA